MWNPFMTRSWSSFSNWGGWAAFGPLGGRRRFFEPGQVRLAVLSLLKEGPKHGYELIKQFEVRSGGLYRASAGTVYPTLQLLEDEGLIVSETIDGKRVYRITPEGLAELEREADTVDEIWGRAERWEEWSRCMGPQAFVIAGPLGTWSSLLSRRPRQRETRPTARNASARSWNARGRSWRRSPRPRRQTEAVPLSIRTEDLRKVFTSAPPAATMAGAFSLSRAPARAKGKKEKIEIVALAGLSLEVRPGEIFGLLGPNGAGKSTTVGILTTRVRPTAGRAWIGDHDVWQRRVAVKRADRCRARSGRTSTSR